MLSSLMERFNIQFQQTSGLRFLWIGLIVLIVDQASKVWISNQLAYGEAIEIFSFFNLRLAHNYGAAFGFLADQGGWQKVFFSVIAIVVSTALLIWLKANTVKLKWQNVSLTLILGGAIGNLIDRVVYGYVVDFLDVYFAIWDYTYPTFNVADSAIVLGAAIMLIDSVKPLDNVPQESASE
jgi:signal peptidase II